MGLLHGAAPDLMVLCHQPSRAENDYGDPIGDLARAVRVHEGAMTFKTARVAAVSLLTWDLPEKEARAAISAATRDTGLPATDPFRFGIGPIAEAVLDGIAGTTASRVGRGGRGGS
jgi:uncharacterized NAD-dependent epimerase/dehydratase family protein